MQFEVSKVDIGTKPLPTTTPRLFVERLVNRSVESCSFASEEVCDVKAYHGLVCAAHYAFAKHYPLVLSPDMIWLTIGQGLARHINNNAESMRNNFVTHDGKEMIKVRRDTFFKGNPENDWEGVFDEFGEQIREYIGQDNYDLICSDFSTTGPVEKAASEIVLMDAMQSYFDYRVYTMCGIPSVILEGSVDDWEKLHHKVIKLRNLIPDWWYDSLQLIATEFVSAAKGNPNEAHWKSLYKLRGGSGGDRISGWIVELIPYIKSYNTGDDYVSPNNVLMRPECYGIEAANLPPCLAKAPFIWDYLGAEYEYEFISGIVGVSQDSSTLAIRPKIGWMVAECK